MDKVIIIAIDIDDYIHGLIQEEKDPRIRQKLLGEIQNLGPTEAIMAYAKAIVHWEQDNKNKGSFFSTEDETVLKFKKQLTEKFGLPVMEREEALRYAEDLKKHLEVLDTWVNGFGPN